MLRGLYTASSGMIAQQRKHDAVTNNIANLNTPGFKQEHAISRPFPEMLISLMNGGDGQASRPIGSINTGTIVEEIVASFVQGDLQQTGRHSDFALISQLPPIEQGDNTYYPQAFFTVQGLEGAGEAERRYTRNGQFHVNDAGELVTQSGHLVLGRDGEPIRLDNVAMLVDNFMEDIGAVSLEQVRMGADGTLYHAETGYQLYRPDFDPELGDNPPLALLISQIDNPYNLRREGHGMFMLNNPAANPAGVVAGDDVANISVMQGYIERSNVDPTQAMVDMMTAARLYEANQQVIKFYDRSLEKAVNEIGRI